MKYGVKDGYEAIKAGDKESFDLVLVDLGMPQMNGRRKTSGLAMTCFTKYL